MAFLIPSCLCFLILLPLSVTAKTQGNITLGSSLTAGESSSWVSPSGDFAFGFQRIGPAGGFLLAIWFNKIPEKTIVWSANREKLAQSGSKAELATDGSFVLNDPAGNKIWSANSDGTGAVAYAAMLDTGNLVLATNTAIIVWQSFDSPTDTILPTQSLNQGDTIVARYSEANYSSGRFLLTMQTDGNLVLYTVNTPLSSTNFAYWATNTVGSGFQVEFNKSGSVYLIAKNGTIMSYIFADKSSTEDFYQRAILEYDGVFRKYAFPKPSSPNSGRWPAAWSIQSFIPSNICTSVREPVGAGGVCGFNSLCQLGGDQRPNCTCPPGYIWVDPDDETLGCRPNFAPQLCSGAGSEASNQFHLVQILNANWPYADYQYYTGVTEDWCRVQCLADCFCAAAITKDDGECWMKNSPLLNGLIDSSVGLKALLKIGNSNISTTPLQDGGGGPKKQDHSTLIIVLGSSVCFLLLLLLVFSSIVVFLVKNKSSRAPEQQHQVLPGTSTRVFSYEELVQATANFREKVGQGAFATVYKGNLDPENGSTDLVVAVKRVDKVVKDSDKEFEREVSAIARTNHRNLVRLVGYCNEGQHRLLVYEFMNNGSVADVLFGDEEKPSWFTRMQIAVGTARGLYYLHEECSTQIIHCDIKPQNVLLDDSFTARISDFGIAKLLRVDQTRTTTCIRGTKGYVAPEWFRNLPVTVKVDVYSYGILLLELVCCRKCFQETSVDENFVLADWASDCYRQGSIYLLVENDEDARNDLRRVEKYVKVAIWCIQEEPSLRPPMKKVIQMLEGSIEVPVPPDPSSYISSI